MQSVGLVLSVLLHVVIFLGMVHFVDQPLDFGRKPLITLDLLPRTEPKPEQPAVAVPPPVQEKKPEPAKARLAKPVPAPLPTPKPPAAMAPRLAAEGGKTLAKPKPVAARPAAPPPPPPPGKPISDVRSDDAPPLNDDPELEAFAKSGGYVSQEAEDQLKHGAETRFGHVLGFYTYTTEQFVGQYNYGEGGSVMVIDARDTPAGRLLLYDSKSGLFRTLRQFGRYIYTYGPAFGQDEPVQGSVTFLADGTNISRLIWMDDSGKSAIFPNKKQFIESQGTFTSGGTTLAGTLIMPTGEGPYPAVVWVAGPDCQARQMLAAAARQLAVHNIAALVYDPRGCGRSGGKPADPAAQAADALAGLKFLRQQPKVDKNRVGFFGRDAGVTAAALASAGRGSGGPDFLVQAVEEGTSIGLSLEELEKIKAPSLWIFSSHNPQADFSQDLAVLDRLAVTQPLRTILAPETGPTALGQADAEFDALRLEHMALGFTRHAAPFILER